MTYSSTKFENSKNTFFSKDDNLFSLRSLNKTGYHENTLKNLLKSTPPQRRNPISRVFLILTARTYLGPLTTLRHYWSWKTLPNNMYFITSFRPPDYSLGQVWYPKALIKINIFYNLNINMFNTGYASSRDTSFAILSLDILTFVVN